MRRLLAVAVLVALAVSGTALAGRGDPQKRINPADQARAKQMLLRKADFPATFKSSRATDSDDPYCKALDESDLTLTGEAESPGFEPRQPAQGGGIGAVSSYAQVYESLADANASWRRGTSAAGIKCARDMVRREIEKGGSVTFVSFKRVSFPRLADRVAAFRVVARSQGVPLQLDFVAFMESRAHATVAMLALPVPTANAELQRLTRLVASRMRAAMRGA